MSDPLDFPSHDQAISLYREKIDEIINDGSPGMTADKIAKLQDMFNTGLCDPHAAFIAMKDKLMSTERNIRVVKKSIKWIDSKDDVPILKAICRYDREIDEIIKNDTGEIIKNETQDFKLKVQKLSQKEDAYEIFMAMATKLIARRDYKCRLEESIAGLHEKNITNRHDEASVLGALSRYEGEIDAIINEVPRGVISGDKIAKLQKLFNGEDSYAVFMSVVFKLIANRINTNRLMGRVIEQIDNHELRVKILKLAQDYLGEAQE